MSQAAAEGGAAAAEGGAAASRGLPSPPASSSSSFPAIDGWAAELIADAAEDGEPRRKAAAEEREAGGARPLAYCLPAETGKEMKEIEECIEEMLIRLDEFCGMTDMIRSDTSNLLEEMIPLIKAKVSEMNNVYTKVDKLEAFVKMAGHHVSFLEEQILQAEKTHAGCPSSIQKLLGSLVFPLFKKEEPHVLRYLPKTRQESPLEQYFSILSTFKDIWTSTPAGWGILGIEVHLLKLAKTCTPDAQQSYNLPELYRTEDYFPIKYIGSKYQSH